MSLEEFKFIYWMEYAHRMWGRALGFVFAVPAVYFGLRGYINLALSKNLGLFFLMGGTQGLVGWWMVKSGLQVRLCVSMFLLKPCMCHVLFAPIGICSRCGVQLCMRNTSGMPICTT